jgi:hypothetical protein
MRLEEGNISIIEKYRNIKGKIEILEESNVMKKLPIRTLRGCLRRPTQGRWIPVGSHSLRSVRPQMEDFLTEQKNVFTGIRTRSREASAIQRATLAVRPLMENLSTWRPKTYRPPGLPGRDPTCYVGARRGSRPVKIYGETVEYEGGSV